MPIRADGTGAFRDASARFACYLQQDREDRADDTGPDARKERDEADDHRPLHRVEAGVDFNEAGFHLAFEFLEAPIDLVEALVDVIEALVDVLLEVVQSLV